MSYSLVDKINMLNAEEDKAQNSIILKQRLADLLDTSHKILKFRSLKPLNSTRDRSFDVTIDNAQEEFSLDDSHFFN